MSWLIRTCVKSHLSYTTLRKKNIQNLPYFLQCAYFDLFGAMRRNNSNCSSKPWLRYVGWGGGVTPSTSYSISGPPPSLSCCCRVYGCIRAMKWKRKEMFHWELLSPLSQLRLIEVVSHFLVLLCRPSSNTSVSTGSIRAHVRSNRCEE